jgi:hypothetical protein
MFYLEALVRGTCIQRKSYICLWDIRSWTDIDSACGCRGAFAFSIPVFGTNGVTAVRIYLVGWSAARVRGTTDHEIK